MAKKTLLTLSLLILALASCGAFVACLGEGEELSSGEFSYILLEDGTACITGYNYDYYDHSDGTVEIYIPETIGDEYVVSEIGDAAFQNGTVTSIYYDGSSLRRIGENAFYQCANLKSVDIYYFSESAELTIGDGAFYYCSSLESFNQLFGVTKYVGSDAFTGCEQLSYANFPELRGVGDGAFSLCKMLTLDNLFNVSEYEDISNYRDVGVLLTDSGLYIDTGDMRLAGFLPSMIVSSEIEVPTGVNIIGQYAFMNSKFTNVYLPEGIQEIRYGAFAWTQISEINLPASLTSILGNPFLYCQHLATITVSDQNETFTSLDGVLVNMKDMSVVTYPDGMLIDGEAYIPEGVRSINSQALALSAATKVTLPDGLESIGESAFNQAYNLTSIVIPDSVIEIKDYAFQRSALQSVSLPNVEKLGNRIFEGCTNLVNIEFADDVKTIGMGMFYQCVRLTNVEMPEGLEKIDEFAFGITNLRNIVIPSSVTEVGNYAFARTPVESVYISNVTARSNNVFLYCSLLKDVVFADDVTSIGDGLFNSCTGLSTVDLPANLETIGKEAFKDTGLTQIELSDTVKSIGANAFENCALKKVYLPNIEYGENVFFNNANLKTVEFDDSIEAIPDGMFKGCAAFASVKLPTSLKRIGVEAFSNTGITKLQIPETVEYIGDRAFMSSPITAITLADIDYGTGVFSNCKKLSKVTLSNDIEVIPAKMFQYCEKLADIKLPTSLKNIGESAFSYTGLKKIVIPDTVESVGNAAFNGSAVTSATLSNAVYGEDVFSSCQKLNKIVFAEGIETIPEQMFKSCVKLASVTFPKSLKTIESYAFYDTGLTKLTIPETVESIGDYAFSNTKISSLTLSNIKYGTCAFGSCAKLSKIKFAEDIELITYSMFSNCSKLSAVELPQSLKKIESYAFYNTALAKIVIPDSVEEIEYAAFSDCAKLRKVTLPSNLNTDSIKEKVFEGTQKVEFITK